MIVLDSTQWFKEIIPYGFVFYDQTHWLVLNTGMDYANFKSVYGFNGISKQLDSSFSKNNIKPEEVIYSRLKFLSLHELGIISFTIFLRPRRPIHGQMNS